MVRRVLAWGGAIVAGIVLGAVSAWAALTLGATSLGERHGSWRLNRATGAEAADPYTRAIVAREGLLALSTREALYLTLDRDENGRPLGEACIYALSGGDIEARWWSVTLYASDDYLAQNTDNAHSIDATHLAGGPWRALISPVRGEAATWLSSREARRGFTLTLRVYQPRSDFHPSADTLPALSTLSCAPR